MGRKSYVNNHDEHHPTAQIKVANYRYSFSLSPVDSDRRQWLVDVVECHMEEVRSRAIAATRKEMRDGFKVLLGLD